MTTETTTVLEHTGRTWTEAPASATLTFAHPSGAGVLFTLRADSGRDLLAMVDAAVKAAVEGHGWAPTAGARIGAYSNGPPAPAAAGALATAATAGEQVTPAEWVSVLPPNAKGLVTAEFWQAGREYPEERVVQKPERIASLLAPLGFDATPARHDVACRVVWTIGKRRPNGTPYHDVARIEAAS